MMTLKTINLPATGRAFEIRLDTRTNTIFVVDTSDGGKGYREGSVLVFSTPFEMSTVGTALIDVASQWAKLTR